MDKFLNTDQIKLSGELAIYIILVIVVITLIVLLLYTQQRKIKLLKDNNKLLKSEIKQLNKSFTTINTRIEKLENINQLKEKKD